MVNVICAEDCGNAPRKAILRDLQAAWARGDVDEVADWVRDDIVYDVVGTERIVGKEAFRAKVASGHDDESIQELHIHNIITHGWIAALNGTVTTVSGRQVGFCNVFVFAGAAKTAKIKEITSYVLPLGA